MKQITLVVITSTLLAMIWAIPVYADSYYPLRPEDPQAVYLTKDQFPDLKADGVGDDSDVLQEAVSSVRGGIIFIPEGRYRISKTIIVGGGTRLIGYGKERPVIVLAANSPNFQWGTGKYMFHFAQSGLNSGGGGMMGGMMGGRGGMGGQGGMMGGQQGGMMLQGNEMMNGMMQNMNQMTGAMQKMTDIMGKTSSPEQMRKMSGIALGLSEHMKEMADVMNRGTVSQEEMQRLHRQMLQTQQQLEMMQGR